MNYTYALDFGKVVEKLPQDFCDKHPVVVLGSAVLLITLPTLCSGAKYLTDTISSDRRYGMELRYGKPAALIIEASDSTSPTEASAA